MRGLLLVLVLSLGGRALQVRNQVLAVALGLDAGEDHLGALDVVLGRQQVLEEGVLPPDDARVLVGRGVGVVLGLARLAAKEAVEVGALLVRAALWMVEMGSGGGWGEPRVWWWCGWMGGDAFLMHLRHTPADGTRLTHLLDGVALGALGLENLGTLLGRHGCGGLGELCGGRRCT